MCPKSFRVMSVNLGDFAVWLRAFQLAPDQSALDADGGLRIPARNGSMPLLQAGAQPSIPTPFPLWMVICFLPRGVLEVGGQARLGMGNPARRCRPIQAEKSPEETLIRCESSSQENWEGRPGSGGEHLPGVCRITRPRRMGCLAAPSHFRPVLGNKMQSVSGRPSVFPPGVQKTRRYFRSI